MPLGMPRNTRFLPWPHSIYVGVYHGTSHGSTFLELVAAKGPIHFDEAAYGAEKFEEIRGMRGK